MSNSEYSAHSEPLFKSLKLLTIEDVYKLKLMKFFYNLSYNLLPSYFNYYLEVINNAFPCQYELRQIARPLIRPQRTPLSPHIIKCFISIDIVIKLHRHTHTHTHYPELLENVKYKKHTYYDFKLKHLGQLF